MEALEDRTLLTIFVVDTVNELSLRQAIRDANANPGLDFIHFNIPGDGVQTIRPTFGLPDITDPVIINATTQPGWTPNTPMIALDGSLAGDTNGLEFRVGGNTVQGLVIHSFKFDAIVLVEPGSQSPSGGNTIQFNFLGTDATGTVAKPNRIGLHLVGSPNNVIKQNLISGNSFDGIEMDFAESSGNVVQGNNIGGDVTGLNALGNGLNGIFLGAPDVPFLREHPESDVTYASGNLIGGLDLDLGNAEPLGNLIVGNAHAGVYIFRGGENQVQGNYIGVAGNGAIAIPNGTAGTNAEFGADGVFIEEGHDNEIGGVEPGAGNVISANVGAGVRISAVRRAASENVIQGNRIGTDGSGHFQEGLGNQTNGIEITNTTNDISGEVSAINFIGGDDELDGEQDGAVGARNIISGNGRDGILVAGHFLETVIQGNYIGVDIDGLIAAPNGRDGIRLTAFAGQDAESSVTIIGSLDPERHETGNLISGNVADGIFIGFGAKAQVFRNAIGINKDGSDGLGNGRNGLTINDSSGNRIGGRTTFEDQPVSLGNIISANVVDGVTIGGGSRDNHLIGNLIGVDKDQGDKLGNGRHGVSIFDSPSNHIGDATAAGRNVIVNSKQFGVLISGVDSRLNTLKDNYIGVNLDGTTPRGNQTAGVVLLDATDNTIGGTAGERNLISANQGPGVQIENGNLNKVLGNSIGSDSIGEFREDLGNFTSGVVILNSADNTVRDNQIRGNGVLIGSGIAIGGPGATGNKVEANDITHNSLRGVNIFNAASDNYIGGADTDARNVISANPDGVFIEDGAHDNHVVLNLIGTDESGAVAEGFGNTQSGIVIVGAHSNEVRGNSIRGNATGILISGDSSRDNTVRGNRITNNAEQGVEITAGAIHNTVGGLLEQERNLISKNKEGVRIESLARDNVVTENFIGTDETGAFNSETGNSVAGVVIRDAHENQIAGNTIRGNVVGVSISGADAKRNLIDENVITHSALRGIHLLDGAADNSIGLVLGNLISANADGVVIAGSAHDNRVNGNRIGTNEAGAFQEGFGNTDNGIVIFDGRLNTVQRNIVRGSGGGIGIVGGDGNIIRDNTITNNRDEGILLSAGAFNNLIGGRNGGSSNIITNNGAGVRVEVSSHHNEIIDNRIGTDASGEINAALGNTGPGLSILDAHHTIVESNVIRSNRTGISISGAAANFNAVRDNIITHSTEHGVHILDGASDNPIGGLGAEDFNRISENLKSGVVVESGVNNAVLRNRIFGNFSLGIDLGDNGVSLNEKLKDTDAGPNNLQNFPELAFATVGGSRRIVGTLSSTPATLFVLEFFATMQADSSGFGEAERFVTTTAVTTNASGVASFDLFLPEGEVAGTSLTVTATDPNGNTSEFAKTIRIETDTDGDGVPDRLESDAPNSGDGNQDGIPDSQQPGVASFLSAATSSYVTLALPASAPAGASLSGVRPLSNPSPDDAPSEASFGLGFFDFRITGLAPGAAVAVEQFLPSGMTPISYFRYGPLPGQAAPQWYNWVFDGTTGAVINGNRVKLNFVDGLRGDDDLLVNGTIVDPGGPGYNRALMVTNTLDSGPGSLRQAILDANSRPGFDFIDFAIGSGGPAIISPLSDLPIITDPVFIDGRSQDGFAGSPIIELNGQSDALGTGLTVRAFDTTIRGLVINRFALAGISVTPPGNNSQNNVVIVGNFIGTDITGRLARPNGNGIIVNGGAFHRIGGTTPEGRNVISGNAFDGIVLNGGFGMQLQGNHIGAAADGISPLGNGDNGIRIPNVFTAPFNLTIGGSISSAGNTIAFNGDSGILDLAPNRNIGFLSNSIYSNGLLGISRDPNGKVVLNDIGTSDTGGTNVQNFPVLFSAQSSGGQTAISGYLNSRRNSAYSLQFFSNATIDLTGFGEGQTLIGSTSVTTDANGHVDFTVNLPVALTNGVSITATVTDSSNNTSEFSRRVGVGEVVTNVIIVNSTDDVDDGVADATHTSLREAIHAANNFPGSNEIHFAIGSGVRTINVLTPLPAIVEAVTIDGTTQPGFTGSPIIELDGSSRVTKGFVGFPTTEFNDSSGLAVNASNTTIRGLVINRFAVSVLASLKTNPPSQLLVQQPFAAPGIDVYSIGAEVSFGGVIIEGNYIGTDVTGMLPRPNSGGIHIRGGNNHRVGGTTPAQRNVISGNMGNGIDIHIGDSHLVQGNFIGVGADGIMPLGNTTPDLVVDSRIVAYSSWGNGIAINTAGTGNVTHTTIGGLQAGAGNLIAFNGRDGISTGLPFAGNPILSNSIHSNRLLGISFGSHQVVLNEQTLLFDAAGRIVKYPVIHSAESASGQTTIAGHFDGAANANFLIQFFSSATVDASGFGEGETFIGSTSVTTNASGHVDFTATLPVAVANRRLLTATATDAAGSTSQFSRRQAVGEVHTGIFIVNTTDDVDDGTADATHTSLREAIHAANNNPGSDEIRFAIGSGIQTITPLTPLPVIVDSTVIDGWTQPGFAGTPIIELSGALMDREQFDRPSATSFYMHGIDVLASNSTVRGLVINRFLEFTNNLPIIGLRTGGQPLTVSGNGNVIEGVYVGTNVAGTSALANFEPVRITGNNNRLGGKASQQRNLFAAGREGGINISGDNNILQGNFVGTNAAGNAAIPNSSSTPGRAAVSIIGANNRIGGGEPGAGNLISGNNLNGLDVSGPGNVIQGNFIGTNAAGATRLGNSGNGLNIAQSPFLALLPIIVGGTLPFERNIISGNSIGILVNGSDGVIQGNLIGTDITGTLDLGNTLDGIFLNSGDSLLIGGTATGAGNLISGNDRFGILVARSESTGHRIQGNRIGTQADGVSPLGNGSDGIAFGTDFFASTNGIGPVDSLIGGTEAGAGNIIAFNTGRGVNIAAGRRIGILSNAIFSNGQLGIDLNVNGVTSNDSGDADSGDNSLQNFPVLSETITDGTRTSISGTFNSLANTTFVLQLFSNAVADATGFGEGQTLLASRSVTTDGAGNASFTIVVNIAVPVGQFIAATATDGANNTSEFSLAKAIVAGTVEVTNGPPAPLAGGPYTINEGSSLTVDASTSSDPDGDQLSFSWDINGDGTFGDAVGTTPTLTWTQLQALGIVNGPSSFDVQVRADDAAGHVVTSSVAKLDILNVKPVVNAGPSTRNVLEAVQVDLSGTFTDPGTADTHTLGWHVAASNGQVIADGTGASFSFIPLDNGTYTVTIMVTDSDQESGTAVVTVIIANADPIASIIGQPASGTVGVPIQLSSSVSDPSPVDVAAGLRIQWFADLTPEYNVEFTADTPDFSFTPTEPGIWDVALIVKDKDNGRRVVQFFLDVLPAPSGMAPGVSLAPDASLNEGSNFTSSGSFTDPDSGDTWTATVNYGDGSGDQPLTLNADKTFDLTHFYADNGTFDIVVTVTDSSNRFGVETTHVTVKNLSPSAEAIDGQTVKEGDLVNLLGSFSDPGTADTHTFNWHVVASNGQLVADGSAQNFQFVPNDNGTYTVTFQVTDDDGESGSDSLLITVNNVAPTANAGPDQTIDEGTLVTLIGNFTDPGSADTHTFNWHVVASNGQLISDGSGQNFQFVPLDNGIYTVTFTVTDDDGLAGTDSVVITVMAPEKNVPPQIVSFSSGDNCTCTSASRSVTVSGEFTDRDLLDHHTVIIDWGDGTTSSGLITEAGGTGAVTASHQYSQGGIYVVTLRLSDDDSTVSAQTNALVVGARVHNGVLEIVGTKQDDRVKINTVGSRSYRVDASFFEGKSFRHFPSTGVTRIVVMLCDGNDFAHIGSNIQVPALLDGGNGKDNLKGAGGPDVLLGRDGDDVLDGGGNCGRDLLIGGRGADRLIGNAGDDLLIAGTTRFDNYVAALDAIMAEWTSKLDYAVRVANLGGAGSGPAFDRRRNGNYFLISSGPNATVFGDGARDQLTGSAGWDWFFATEEDKLTDPMGRVAGRERSDRKK